MNIRCGARNLRADGRLCRVRVVLGAVGGMNFRDCRKNSRVDGMLCRVGVVNFPVWLMIRVFGGMNFPLDGNLFPT